MSRSRMYTHKGVELDRLLSDEKSNGGKHSNAGMLRLRLTPLLHVVQRGTLREVEGVELGSGVERSGQSPSELRLIRDPSVEVLDSGGGASSRGRGEGGGGNRKGGEDGELHRVNKINYQDCQKSDNEVE